MSIEKSLHTQIFVEHSIDRQRPVRIVSCRVAGDHATRDADCTQTSTQNSGEVPTLSVSNALATRQVLVQDLARILPRTRFFAVRKVFRPIAFVVEQEIVLIVHFQANIIKCWQRTFQHSFSVRIVHDRTQMPGHGQSIASIARPYRFQQQKNTIKNAFRILNVLVIKMVKRINEIR